MEVLAQSWLDQQCKIIQGVARGIVILGVPDQDSCTPVACWPSGSTASPELLATARAAMSRRRAIINTRGDGEGQFDTVAYPLVINNQAIGIVALEVASRPDSQQRAVIQLLKWGSAWLEMLVEQHTAATREPLVTVLETLALCLEHERFQATATAVATALAARLSCNRVSIGFLRGNRIRVRALSHTARFAGKTNLLRGIAAAMEEAVDQDSVLVYPGGDEDGVHITRAHAELAGQHDHGAICTVPLVNNNRLIGALALERAADQPFDEPTVELCKQIAVLVGPALELKRRDDRWLLAKARESLHGLLRKLFGPRHPGLKLTAITFAALVGVFAIAEGDFHVTADAALEGRVQRSVVAAMDGFIATSTIRAGDVVHQGQLMGELDDRDLKLEHRKWTSKKAQYAREYRSALAEHERAQVAILGARIDQAGAQLELVNEQLARTHILAPFDGIVVSGDLSQSLGAPVERGEVLFEVAPLDDYRLLLRVDERDIPELGLGQKGVLRLSGMPGEALPISIEKITPVSETGPEGNFFRVEARLDRVPESLRPGMEGIGKLDIGQRKLLWIWSHRLVDWMRLWAWSWWP